LPAVAFAGVGARIETRHQLRYFRDLCQAPTGKDSGIPSLAIRLRKLHAMIASACCDSGSRARSRAAFQDILELGCCNCNASDFWSKIDAAAIRDVGVSNR
jgi:hypothetical protein